MSPEHPRQAAGATRGRGLIEVAVYVLMILTAVAVFFIIRSQGQTLTAPAVVAGSAAHVVHGESQAAHADLLRLLFALAAIIMTGQALSFVFARIGQPPVIGEVVAGILLGPSLLGPEISALILPPSVAPSLGVVAQIGVILYMFLVGLDLNPALLAHRARAVILTSHAAIILPFLMGSALALVLYPRLASDRVPFTSFALFLGVAMAITAFPVLARILGDLGLSRTDVGGAAIACAAIDDVTAWCLLALVVGIAQAHAGLGLLVAGGTIAYVAFMFLIARPILSRMISRDQDARPSRAAIGLIFVALLLSALATQAIGIHAIFGAFLLGAVIPHDSPLSRAMTRGIEPAVTFLLLPAFFAFTGMRTRVDLLVDAGHWILCLAIVGTAIVGKFVGTALASRLTGFGWRDAAVLGALMNTRGLMELVVLNVGLDLGVIAPPLFAMMVLMALVTTLMTAPLVRALMGRRNPGPSAS